MEKKEKKGFWASLFSPKPCRCSCGEAFVIPAEEQGKESADVAHGDSQGIKEIKVLGPGCAKCKSTYAVVEKVVKASGLDVKLTKVDDIEEIMRYNILATPAIVVDGKAVMKGRVPTVEEVERILGLVN
ncbi:MAG: thioredoxin family protein [Alloprevotella sp.]